MFRNRFRSVITFLLILVLTVPLFTTTVSAAYENTYKNTGNMRNDIIGVALTQVGYKEGKNNYTKYGVWYGKPNSPWCGMFVSWCAKEAGIPTSVLKRTGVANPKNFGLSYKSGKDYTPQKGDLFFKKGFSHVGLVYYTEGDYFYTIEGNTYTSGVTTDCVMIRKRKISDFYFSSPDYSGSGTTSDSSSSSGCNHKYTTKTESKHPHKEYKICTKCEKKIYTGKKGTSKKCSTCIQASCEHTFSEWKKASDSKHTRVCSKCELKETEKHTWKENKVLKEATCTTDGKMQLICTGCDATKTKTIQATGQHQYGTPTFIDETSHMKVCKVCNKQVTAKHSVSKNWESNNFYHWTFCEDCGLQLKTAEHTHSDGCTSPCETCGYVDEDGHSFNGNRGRNAESHWDICDTCEKTGNEEAHQYTAECDTVCNTCGFVRTVTVAHQETYHADHTGHWKRCSVCNSVSDIVEHTADAEANDWENQYCIHCGYLLRSNENHTHGFEQIEYDSEQHWGICACGEERLPEVHSWDFQTGKCSVCGIEHTDKENTGNFLTAIIHYIFG